MLSDRSLTPSERAGDARRHRPRRLGGASAADQELVPLLQELVALRREQFNLRMQRGTGQFSRPHLMKDVRRNIARVKTIMTEKRQAGEA